jgi:hypothetical protein
MKYDPLPAPAFRKPTSGAKWLETLKELAPRVTHVAVMFRLMNRHA